MKYLTCLLFIYFRVSGICASYVFVPFTPEHFAANLIEEKCINQTSPVEIENSPACVSIVEFDHEEIEEHRKNGTLLNYFKNILTQIDDCHAYGEPMYKFGIECLEHEDVIYMNKTRNAYNKITEYMFGNDAQRAIAFTQERGFDCLDKYVQQSRECASLFSLLLLGYNDDDSVKVIYCKFFNKLKLCYVDIQKKCPNITSYSYLHHSLDLLLSEVCVSESISRETKDSPGAKLARLRVKFRLTGNT